MRRRRGLAFGIKVVCALLSCAVLGCADVSCDLGEAVRRCVGRMSLESASDFQNAERLCEEAARLLLQRPSPEARKAMERLGGYYREIAFDDRTYFTRERSLSRYFGLVRHTAALLAEGPGFSEGAWRFQLDAAERVNLEIERCRKEPPGGPYGNVASSRGPFKTQRQYLSDLEAERFRFIREGFETGPFTRYFHSLSAPSRHEWMERLSVVAWRKVVIWDPDNQMAELPVLKSGDGGRGTDAAPGMRTERLGDGVEAIMRPVKKPK